VGDSEAGPAVTGPFPIPRALAEAAAREGRSGWLVQWLFARCVQESPDDPDLAGVARRLS
jgi:hypothetical protein